ncbi:MAG: hypothetical protein IKV92_03315 [Akkermansia sp.]|nr:hypothetical protein [Akkermansia sp.]
MKKTLISLIACAGFSSAATLNTELTLTEAITAPVTLTGMKSSSFSLVASLDVDFLQTYMSGSKTMENGYVIMSASNGSQTLGVAFDTLSDNNTYLGATTLTATDNYVAIGNNSNYWKSYAAITGVTGIDATPGFTNSQINWSKVEYAALTMVHNNTSNTQFYLSVSYLDGSIYTLAGTQGNLKWKDGISAITSLSFNSNAVTSIDVYDGALAASEAVSKTTAQLPEPTTATLSLLALAGFAARRRRR